MIKNLLVLLFLFLMIPAHAIEYETALNNGRDTVLYFYTPQCGYCQRFSPIYAKLSKIHGDKINFVKTDCTTLNGYKLGAMYGVRYVPYVVVIKSNKKNMKNIPSDCLLKYACVDNEIKNF